MRRHYKLSNNIISLHGFKNKLLALTSICFEKLSINQF